MYLISSLLFGFSASIDAFIVGMTYGVKRTHISFSNNLLVSVITLAGTILSILAGSKIVLFFPKQAATTAGSLLLILLGIYYILKFIIIYLKKRTIPKELSDSAPSCNPSFGFIGLQETMALGLALSVNNVGIGLGASISGIHLLPTAVITFALSVLLLALGNRLGKMYLLRFAGRFADPLAGMILIVLGLYEWLT